jgi:cytochrome P450
VTDTTQTLGMNFFTPEAIADPYSMYREIQRRGFTFWSDEMNGWTIFGFEEASAILSDPATFPLDVPAVPWFVAPNLLTVEGDTHKRLRGVLAPYFTRSAVARWEVRVREIVRELLQPLEHGSGSYDLIEDFTKIPTVIVLDMLGVASEKYEDYRRWSHEIISNVNFAAESEAAQQVMLRASEEVKEEVSRELERHRRDRPDDLITAMIEASGAEAMSDDEVHSAVVLLVLAGYDTTAKTMASALIALQRNPDQRELLLAHPEKIPAAIEESLRWCSAGQYVLPRKAAKDVELGGRSIRAGDTVFAFIAAANRDPTRWDEPDRYDIDREAKAHLGFGFGTHLCLGASLARLETTVALEELLRIAPHYRLSDIDYGSSFFVRGPEAGRITPRPEEEQR